MAERRTAWLTASDDGLVVGDPFRDHLHVGVSGVVHRRLDLDAGQVVDVARWEWDAVRDLIVSAPTSRTARPGLWAFLRAAVVEATGWASTLASAPVHVRLVLAGGTDELLVLDGHAGGGYPETEQEQAHQLLGRVLGGRPPRPDLVAREIG